MTVGSCNDSTQPFAKTICSICYEDLKPITEDLQAISLCGHVFHELCIQQWFEYCSKGKKKCPICKQTCSASNVSRLYFQSVGDSNDPNLSPKLQTHKENPEELKLEVRRLEAKISGLSLALESRESDFVNLIDQYSVCKEQLKEEAALKNEAMGQTHTINSLLNMKTKALDKLELERIKLQNENMALAKELAALKLVYAFDLKEDRIVKLASLGTEPHSTENVNTLAKLLVVRNKMYTELMTKYKTLGGDEAWSRKDLEMARKNLMVLENLKEKTRKMKTAKASKMMKDSPSVLNGVDPTLHDTYTPQDKIKEPDVHLRKTKRLRETENDIKSNNKDGVDSYILIDDDAPKDSISPESTSYYSVPQPTKRVTTDDDMEFVYETGQEKPLPNIINETPLPVPSSQEAAEPFYSAGVLGPNGTSSYLGRWCKRDQNKGFNFSSASPQSSGNLIASGPDGRGGTMKVLKSLNLPSKDSTGSLFSAKNSKVGAKTSSSQSRGSLQIDHFFSKAGK